MPTDIRLIVTLLTLLVFLILRIPTIWRGVGLTRGRRAGASLAGGLASIVIGVPTLTVHQWAAPTHTFGGVNFADVWHVAMTLAGWGLVLAGAGYLAKRWLVKMISRSTGNQPMQIPIQG